MAHPCQGDGPTAPAFATSRRRSPSTAISMSDGLSRATRRVPCAMSRVAKKGWIRSSLFNINLHIDSELGSESDPTSNVACATELRSSHTRGVLRARRGRLRSAKREPIRLAIAQRVSTSPWDCPLSIVPASLQEDLRALRPTKPFSRGRRGAGVEPRQVVEPSTASLPRGIVLVG